MSGSLSNALEIKLLDHVLKTTPFSVPANIYVALFVGDPTDAGDGGAEVSGTGYTRIVANTWDAAASRATENTGQIIFPQAGADWGTVDYWAIYDADTGGNFLAHGDFTESKACPIGTNLYIEAGDIDVTFSAGGICDNLANKLLDHIFKTGGGYTPEDNLYVALFTSSPTDDGVSGTEVTGGAYARKVCNGWDAAAAGASENTAAITFDTATASWGTLTHFLLLNHLSDAADGTNTLLWATIDPNRVIGIDDVAEYAAGALDVTLD
ncbi:hypothetical protein ES695_06490 [Candidatus Atribacteria bacterium 1244-E10-H5-B2]|nr:MAG: hypothetical protein ES695_06490 [Candidatus Atribacteria bacterium 1244-E10-H5-B2]